VLTRREAGSKPDLWAARLDAARDSVLALRPLTRTPDAEAAANVSPDGRWLAYQSDQTGRPEVYVAPLRPDGLGPQIQLTDQGGAAPEWVSPGVVYFRGLDQQRVYLMTVGADPATGDHAAREWFDMRALGLQDMATMHNGNAIVVESGPLEREGPRAVNLVFGWAGGLKRRLSAR
ncbi:MAG TPA: hypothetical protein VI792_12295, partial [Candidatus Eisenbacteria bacterium]